MRPDHFVAGVPLGRWQTNCYVLGDRSHGTAVVVDPGETGERAVPDLLGDLQVRCEAILLTHGHIDHIWAVPELARDLDVDVFLHPDDRWLWDDPAGGIGIPRSLGEELYGGPWEPPTDRLQNLVDGMRLRFAGIGFTATHTPGHTPGHVTLLASGVTDAELLLAPQVDAADLPPAPSGMLLSGDLVFRDSVGRTDFPRGSTAQLMASIERTVLPMDDDTVVLPGHLQATSVGRERARNPFLTQLRTGL